MEQGLQSCQNLQIEGFTETNGTIIRIMHEGQFQAEKAISQRPSLYPWLVSWLSSKRKKVQEIVDIARVCIVKVQNFNLRRKTRYRKCFCGFSLMPSEYAIKLIKSTDDNARLYQPLIAMQSLIISCWHRQEKGEPHNEELRDWFFRHIFLERCSQRRKNATEFSLEFAPFLCVLCCELVDVGQSELDI
jgi:hypothetical protein